MDWEEVCAHPDLRNLPFKIELNARGQVIMTPTKPYHSGFQARISERLADLLGSTTFTELAIKTRLGTRVVAVGWASPERYDAIFDAQESALAPEICVEILSDSNTRAELDEKKQLYFEQGCLEFWTCSAQGDMRFCDRNGELERSKLAPRFARRVPRRG